MTAKPVISSVLPPDRYALTAADRERFAEERDRGMVPPSDPGLAQPAALVPVADIGSGEIRRIIDRLYAAAEGQRRATAQGKRRRTLVGLAAPQIGEPWQIVLIDTKVRADRKHLGKLECFINPEIVWQARQTAEGREGCFSAGPVWGLVRRPVALKIRAYTPQGDIVERILEDFSARIAAHELDHLAGIRFPERITRDRKRHWVHTEELADYPDHIQHWPRICTAARWQAYSRGDGDMG